MKSSIRFMLPLCLSFCLLIVSCGKDEGLTEQHENIEVDFRDDIPCESYFDQLEDIDLPEECPYAANAKERLDKVIKVYNENPTEYNLYRVFSKSFVYWAALADCGYLSPQKCKELVDQANEILACWKDNEGYASDHLTDMVENLAKNCGCEDGCVDTDDGCCELLDATVEYEVITGGDFNGCCQFTYTLVNPGNCPGAKISGVIGESGACLVDVDWGGSVVTATYCCDGPISTSVYLTADECDAVYLDIQEYDDCALTDGCDDLGINITGEPITDGEHEGCCSFTINITNPGGVSNPIVNSIVQGVNFEECFETVIWGDHTAPEVIICCDPIDVSFGAKLISDDCDEPILTEIWYFDGCN